MFLYLCYISLLTLTPWCSISYMPSDHEGRFNAPQQWQYSHGYSQLGVSRRRVGGAVLDSGNLRSLEDRRDFFSPVSLLLRNARPVGHHVSIFFSVWVFNEDMRPSFRCYRKACCSLFPGDNVLLLG